MIQDRILELIKAHNLNNNSFAKKIGSSSTVIGNIVSGRKNKPSYKLIKNIALAFDDISLDWLLMGKGNMYRENPKGILEVMQERISLIEAELAELKKRK